MVDSATVHMGFGSATYMLEQLGKMFNELVSRKDDLEDMVQWKDIEEHFHDLEKSLMKRFDELEEKEKAFVKKESETHAFLANRDAVVAAKEQASLDWMQQIKDAAVLAIVEVQKSYKLTSQNPDDVGDSTKNKGIFMGCSALCSSGEGNSGCESKEELPSQRQNYADIVPKLDAAEAPESSIVDSGMLTSSSQIASHCRFDLSGHCNTQGSLANDQLSSCDANGDFGGLKKVNAAIFNLPQHPTLPVFHTKAKVEYPDNDLIGPEIGIDSHVSGAPELIISEVPQSGLAESGGVSWCSEYYSGCQCTVLSVDFNRQGVQGTDCICSNQMTARKVNDDSFGPKNAGVYKHSLPHCATLSSFPVKVKVENCEIDPLHAFRDGTDGQGRVPELHAAEIFKSGVSMDSGTVSEHSKNTWGRGYGDREGTQANGSILLSQLIPSDANGDLVGPGNVDSCFSQSQVPTFSTFPIKVKVEHSHSGLINQYGGAISGHGDKVHKADSAKVSVGRNGITVDSCLVTQCSQNASCSQYRDLSGDSSRPGTAETANTCSKRVTAFEAKGDFLGLRELDINSHNLCQLPTLTTFPVKVKVEYSDNEQIGSQEEGINSHIVGDPELNASPCSQNASECQYDSLPLDCSRQRIQEIDSFFSNQMTAHQAQPDANGLKNVCVNNLHQYPALSTSHIKVKVESLDDDLMGQFRDGVNGSFGMDLLAVKVKSERTDDLDHIPLKKRQNMLLSRHPSVATVAGVDRFGLLEGASLGEPASLMEDSNQHIAGNLKDDGYSVDALSKVAGSHSDGILETKKSVILPTSRFGSSSGAIAGVSGTVPLDFPNDIKCELNLSPNNLHLGHEGDGKSETTSAEYKAHSDQDFVAVDVNMLALSSTSFTGELKFNVMENGSENPCLASLGPASNYNMLSMEDDQEIPHRFYEDEIDHMILRDRIKLLLSRKVSKLDCSRNLKCSRKTVPSVEDHYPTVSENSEPRIIKIRRKRKKTVTDSVETALEEDAPGLLQVLVDKGIVVDEIKLYGGMEEENALDDSANMDNFGELEDVISKVFSQNSSLLKFAPIHCTKGSKTSYCLACLISLVEQTRYLQFRKWPVEWGWCRDLQSFIFVFERHNRIVLERPEYGYATYFFELVDSLPIDWQIKRLVTAMKLSSCSRITIIENRSLLVGKDLTEGEARVLEQYGWAPNTGLGSMLNYCDRVVHDRKNEKDGSEWRSKIGKLLMDGYNGGTIVLPKLPKKAIEYKSTHSQQVMEYMDAKSPKVAECNVSQNPQFIEYRSNLSSHFMKCEGTQSPNIKLEFS